MADFQSISSRLKSGGGKIGGMFKSKWFLIGLGLVLVMLFLSKNNQSGASSSDMMIAQGTDTYPGGYDGIVTGDLDTGFTNVYSLIDQLTSDIDTRFSNMDYLKAEDLQASTQLTDSARGLSIAQMIQNTIMANSTKSATEKAQLLQNNQVLGSALGAVFNQETGKWYANQELADSGGTPLFSVDTSTKIQSDSAQLSINVLTNQLNTASANYNKALANYNSAKANYDKATANYKKSKKAKTKAKYKTQQAKYKTQMATYKTQMTTYAGQKSAIQASINALR